MGFVTAFFISVILEWGIWKLSLSRSDMLPPLRLLGIVIAINAITQPFLNIVGPLLALPYGWYVIGSELGIIILEAWLVKRAIGDRFTMKGCLVTSLLANLLSWQATYVFMAFFISLSPLS